MKKIFSLLAAVLFAGSMMAENVTYTGTIKFGSASGSLNVNAESVTGEDNLENEWTVTTTFGGQTSFTPNAAYAQIGSSNKPASTITFTTTLPESVEIKTFSAKFGGFNNTAGSISLKVGDEEVGTGALNAGNDVTVSSTKTATGNVLTVTVTGIAKGVKAYEINYSYGGEAPVVEHTYTVAGAPAAVFGQEWNASYAENDMEFLANQAYTWIKDSVALRAGTIEFKVVEDHAWTIAWPEQNYKLTIPEDGYYSILIVFNLAADPDSVVEAKAVKVGEIEPVVEHIFFTQAGDKDSLAPDAQFGNEIFNVTITDTDNKMQIDGSNVFFGSDSIGSVYSFRLKTGYKSSSKNFMTINIPEEGILSIAVRTGSNSDSTRTLVLVQSEDTLYNKVVKESDAVEYKINDSTTISLYPYVVVPVKAGKVTVTYPVGSLNFYAFTFTNKNKIAKIGDLSYYLDGENLIAMVIKKQNLSGNIIIPDSVTYLDYSYRVTSIESFAFDGCTGLTSVTIPNSVTSIGDYAFENCSSLTSVNIPNSVTSIGGGAFYGCSGLTSVTFPNSVTSIGERAFDGCTGLTSVTIPNSVTNIGSDAFGYCSGLTSVTIGNSVTSIGSSAFKNCSGLTSVTIPNSVTSIGEYAFRFCSGLTSVTIPNSVTSIGSSAFYGCSGLTSVTIGNSVTSIGSSVFQDCTNIISVVWNAKNCNGYTFGSQVESFTFGDEVEVIPASICYGMKKLTFITIPNSVTSIGDYAFRDCSGLTSVTIPDSVTSIGNSAFYGCTNIISVVWNAKNCNGYTFGSQVESFTFGDEVEVIPASICYGMKKLTFITIPNSVTSIGEYAFENCSSLTSVTIPNSVTSIGDYTFRGCCGLTSVTIGNSVTSIGNCAFSGCTSLTSVTIPNSVTSIGSSAFYGCSGLTSVTIPNSVASIGVEAFYLCTGLTSVTIPNSVTSIGNVAFTYCSGLTSVTIPNSVTSIGEGAFAGCSGLTSVTIPNSVTSIGSYAFDGCTSLKIVINNSALDIVKGSTNYGYVAYYAIDVYKGGDVIGDFVFSKKDETDYVVAYTGSDSQVTLPANYRGGSYGVAAYLFYNNSTVKSITLSNSVTSIGDYAFNGCSNLNVVYIGNSVISIGQEAFRNCPQLYKVIMLPNSVPSGINSAFNTLAGRITYVGNTNYQSGYNVLGTQRVYPNLNSYFTVDGIVYALSNPSKRTCDIIDCDYSGATTEFTIANSVVYRNVTLSVDSININAFRNNQEMTKLTVNNMAGIGDYAFQNCSSLEDVTIQNKGNIGTQAFAGSSTQNPATYTISNVGAIGESAFANCTSIKNLTIDTCVTAIGQSAFENCSSLEDVIIKNNGDIGVQAFANCSKLQKAQLGNQVSEINQSAFSNCVLLDSITMPNTITSLGASAFNNCKKLAYVKLSNQLTSIGQSAFAGCNILPELFIPKSVASIGNSTFQKCSALSVVSFEDGSTPLSLGNNASNQGLFYDCPLDSVYIGRELTYTQTASSGYSPFYRSPSLRSVLISNFPTKVEANEFYGCTKLNFVFIGNGVQSIGDYAFSGCSSIDYFSFGSQVQTIGAEAFSDCVAMTRLYSYSLQPPTCGTSALEDIDKWNCTLYIPKGTTSAYAAANQWQDFFFVEENEEGGDGVKYPISVEYDATKGTVTGAGVYNRGAEAVLIATPAEGFVFVEWEDGSTDPERHIFVYQSATYTAIFSAPTGIDVLNEDEQTGEVYDILGRPVSHPSQGIFIRNGKKVLIK